MITNLKAEDVDKAWEMLGMEPAYTVSNRAQRKICPGTTFCKRAKQDSVHLGMQIERKYLSSRNAKQNENRRVRLSKFL